MSDFTNFRTVRAAKQHRCDQCGKPINVGEQYQYTAFVFEGDFGAYREHPDCRNAWAQLNFGLRDISPPDETFFLIDDEIEPEEKTWVLGKFPLVADRLGWATEAAE